MAANLTGHCCLCGGSLLPVRELPAPEEMTRCSDCQRVIDLRPDWARIGGPS